MQREEVRGIAVLDHVPEGWRVVRDKGKEYPLVRNVRTVHGSDVRSVKGKSNRSMEQEGKRWTKVN